MQRASKKLTKTVDYKLMMSQDLNYVQLKLNVEQKVLDVKTLLIEHTVIFE